MGAPKFKQTPRPLKSSGNTANANRDGTGTLATLGAGAVGGTEMDPDVLIVALVTTTEGMIRFYFDNGTKYLIGEVYVPAYTPSASKQALQIPWKIPAANRLLASASDIIKWSTENGTLFHVTGQAWDYV